MTGTALDALRDALRLDALYRTVERTTGDARTFAMVEVCAIRERIRREIAKAEQGAELLERIGDAMQRGDCDQASRLRRMVLA